MNAAGSGRDDLAAGSTHLPYCDARSQRPLWALPRCGGYGGGELAGEACARAWLKEQRASIGFEGGSLQLIALDMADSLASCTSETERDSVRGQIVGFFATLEERIRPLTRRLPVLDAVGWQDLRLDVEAGLALRPNDQDAYNAEEVRRRRSEAARRGWLTRRRAA